MVCTLTITVSRGKGYIHRKKLNIKAFHRLSAERFENAVYDDSIPAVKGLQIAGHPVVNRPGELQEKVLRGRRNEVAALDKALVFVGQRALIAPECTELVLPGERAGNTVLPEDALVGDVDDAVVEGAGGLYGFPG